MGSSHSKSMLHQAQVKVLRKCETCKTDKDVYYKCEQCHIYMCKSCSIIHQQQTSSHNIREIVSNQPKSVKQPAEIFRNCGLCLTSIKTRYKCTKCQMYMCFKCPIIHQQVFHRINSNTSFSSTERLACKIHKKEAIIKFCYSCLMKPVCSECILVHKNHHLLSLEHQSLLLKGRLSKDLAFTSLALRQIIKQEFENNLIFQNISEEVEKRENISEINTANYTKLRENMDAEQIKLKTNSEVYKSYTSKYKQILETLQSKLDAANAGNEDNISFVLLVSLSSLPNFYFHKLLELIENLVPNEAMETARSFGIKIEERKNQSNIKIKLLKSYEINCMYINKIITLNNKKAFIIEYPSKHLFIMHIKDKIITSNDLSVMAMDIAVTPSKEILLNFNKSDALHQLIITDEGTKPFLSVTPHQVCICCVHVTKYNEIILGVYDNTIQRCSEDGDERKTKLMIFGTDKKHKQSLEYDIYGQRLFTSPHRIKSNINNEILVIDKISLYNGRVMALNREGKVTWIYKGHPQVNSDYNLFDPSDIVTSKVGQIIVTDHRNHALHVLSELGDLLACESVKAKGILFPMSLDLDTSGQLWIGCHSHSKTVKTKLHIVVID